MIDTVTVSHVSCVVDIEDNDNNNNSLIMCVRIGDDMVTYRCTLFPQSS